MPEDLSAADFKDAFSEMVVENYDACFTLLAKVKGKMQPVGVVVGFFPHPKIANLIIDQMLWFPWASPRNRVEAAVNFFVKLRHEIPMMGFALPKDVPFFNTLCRHGMVRRIGTSFSMIKGVQAAMFETRSEH